MIYFEQKIKIFTLENNIISKNTVIIIPAEKRPNKISSMSKLVETRSCDLRIVLSSFQKVFRSERGNVLVSLILHCRSSIMEFKINQI